MRSSSPTKFLAPLSGNFSRPNFGRSRPTGSATSPGGGTCRPAMPGTWSMCVHAGNAAGKRARENLCPVACVDVDVFAGEVAGPNACGTWARVQIHNDRDVFREHLLVSDVLIEGMFASAAAYLDAG